ncbi:dioxygenase [Mesotoga sp. H07pep.5.4]|jgi:beta-lysine 5,6-aminomutase beta subunit|uniref:lysine 5,6-aminomutase subunit beta n=1 Tax=Mesotoga sp. H07pep.5.4 TaxID=1463664 RepID=UPI000EF130BB|nr:OAM dimerization domain-containing protein [Mesotoga sp. H07pep.5.4]RLL84375.1 dioxygenase [Mesotoga sp. H07pep.5.4]
MDNCSEKKNQFPSEIDLTRVIPYGDTLNDGKVQLSFTLPVPGGPEADEAAKQMIHKMGLKNPQIVFSKEITIGFTFFLAYGEFSHAIDYTAIRVPKITLEKMSMEEIDRFIEERIKRRIVVVGASTGTDAHTVGIDAIMNMKGFAGHYGLERYRNIDAYNLGSQVQNEELVSKAIELDADAILVSQTVTAKNVHLRNMTSLVELLEAENIRKKIILIAGGARITHELAKELGYDAGFGPGTFAEDVAAFIVHKLESMI